MKPSPREAHSRSSFVAGGGYVLQAGVWKASIPFGQRKMEMEHSSSPRRGGLLQVLLERRGEGQSRKSRLPELARSAAKRCVWESPVPPSVRT
jgi:hypothetical protein